SRPRRFGKSLLIDTIHCLFEGRKELFEGLFIYERWDWSKKFPVIHIDFSQKKAERPEDLKVFIKNTLRDISRENEVEWDESLSYDEAFKRTLINLSKKNKVVILIDEYDKPIIDNIEEVELAKGMREVLKGFYQLIEGCRIQDVIKSLHMFRLI
ncbi:MAG: AAA family ATPase, partial [Myxococcota bacterium]